MARVIILGGGFGGLAAATELGQLLGDRHDIVLVDERDHFYMGFAKLWDLAGTRPLQDGTAPIANIEHHGVRFVKGAVEVIDPERRSVVTSAGELSGDAIVVALGAGPNPVHRSALAGSNAFDLYDGDELPGMKEALDTVEAGTVVVAILGGPFKCPPAPYEAALIVDERLRARAVRQRVGVTVVTPQPITLPAAGPDASRYVAEHLSSRAIELRAGTAVAGVDPAGGTITLAGGEVLGYSVLLGVPSNVPPPVLAGSALAGPSGWIEPDRFTFRTSFERVYAIGDCTLIPNAKGQLPKAGVFAAAAGRVAAHNIAADFVGSDEVRFDGHGYCFLEVPGQKVAFVEGNFYAEPELDVRITDATAEHFARKQAFERELLASWLG